MPSDISPPSPQPLFELHPQFLVPPDIPPPSGIEGLPGHLALFSTQVPITLYHVYEWYTGHQQLAEKDKISKTNFTKLSQTQQIQELDHIGLQISTLDQAYKLLLHGYPIIKNEYNPFVPSDPIHHELPHIVLSSTPLYQLLQHELRLTRKLTLLKTSKKDKQTQVDKFLSLQNHELRLAQESSSHSLLQLKEHIKQERLSLLEQLTTYSTSIHRHEELLSQIRSYIKNKQKRLQYHRSSAHRHAPNTPYTPRHLSHFTPTFTSLPTTLPSDIRDTDDRPRDRGTGRNDGPKE
jgi:hypothetical protein